MKEVMEMKEAVPYRNGINRHATRNTGKWRERRLLDTPTICNGSVNADNSASTKIDKGYQPPRSVVIPPFSRPHLDTGV